jgi:glycosyltransferase involved in cell wall biosynthesis
MLNLAMQMQAISVVIVCRNEANVIGATLRSLEGLTDDILVYDNGSTDSTIEVARSHKARVEQGSWEGFGKTKKKASNFAKYDWILSLDADEAIDEELKNSILALRLPDESTVFDLKFKNFLGDKPLKYGEWGGDRHIRLFNRKKVNWDEAQVHERLILPPGVKIQKLEGYVLHHTMKDMNEYARKVVNYARLNAEKYYLQGKKANWFKIRMSPAFNFLFYYLIKLGFLDGREGFICAKMTAYYTFLKYSRLRELNRAKNLVL